MHIVIFDFETTGLIRPGVADLDRQPWAVELAMHKYDEDGSLIDEWGSLFRPGCRIPDGAINVHGITNEMVADAPTFASKLPAIRNFLVGVDLWVAHNLSFDESIFRLELHRAGAVLKFPRGICTVDSTMHLVGHRLALGVLYARLFEQPFEEAHRAGADVSALAKVFFELVRSDEIRL